ncbi:MAG: aldo/keto reductase [Bacillota bacterium]
MLYRSLTKNGEKVSLLGYGCMRLPNKRGNIDKELAFEQMRYAYDNGVNYYDTAYFYHGGKSEGILGEFVKRNDIRDKIYIADKLPFALTNKTGSIINIFNNQLKRLDTEYIDFYLMHALGSFANWERLKELGVVEFIAEKKQSGQIKNIGFSFHGKQEEFMKIIEDYEWDFCQIQYNYLDVNYQAGRAGLARAKELGIGVIVMEPLRGGALAAKAPEAVLKLLQEKEGKKSAAYWALRFVMNHEGIGTVLSGMNDVKHIAENIAVASVTTENSMSDYEHGVIDEVTAIYKELMKVPCTGCNYCMPCPAGIEIPSIFSQYNSKYFFGKNKMRETQYIARSVGLIGGKKMGANVCIKCGKCVSKCPQFIDIPTMLQEAHKDFDNKLLRGAMTIAAKFVPKQK